MRGPARPRGHHGGPAGGARAGGPAAPGRVPAAAARGDGRPGPPGPRAAAPGPPPAPPIPAPALELGRAPAPRFISTVTKPLPTPADPGGFACAFAAFRRAIALTECGMARVSSGNYREAREAFEESIASIRAAPRRRRPTSGSGSWRCSRPRRRLLRPRAARSARTSRVCRSPPAAARVARGGRPGPPGAPAGRPRGGRGGPRSGAQRRTAPGAGARGSLSARRRPAPAGPPGRGHRPLGRDRPERRARRDPAELPFWRGVALARLGDLTAAWIS